MKYIFFQFGTQHESPVDSLAEAIMRAGADADAGDASYECVLNDDGSVALDRHALRAAIFLEWDVWDGKGKTVH